MKSVYNEFDAVINLMSKSKKKGYLVRKHKA